MHSSLPDVLRIPRRKLYLLEIFPRKNLEELFCVSLPIVKFSLIYTSLAILNVKKGLSKFQWHYRI